MVTQAVDKDDGGVVGVVSDGPAVSVREAGEGSFELVSVKIYVRGHVAKVLARMRSRWQEATIGMRRFATWSKGREPIIIYSARVQTLGTLCR